MEFSRPRPVREYRRFLPSKIAMTGTDPNGKIYEFMKKDIVKPLIRPKLFEDFNIKNPNYKHNELYNTRMNPPEKWSLDTVARAPDWERLPKIQQFKTYYFPPE